jgi:Sulfotransferase family
MLSVGDIVAEAESRAGIDDSEHAPRKNLARLVGSLNHDARLPPQGEASARKNLIDRTADRLAGLKWLRNYPEIGDEVIAQPVFLTGLPRSGTTFFQYLFDRDSRFRLIRSWEGITPSPPPGYDEESVRRRKAEEGERRRATRPQVSGFEALHLMDADGPEECHAFMEHSHAAAGLQNLYNVPSYFDFLMTALDLTAAYRVHHRQLQLLQWRMPRPRWALKYPNHVIAMPNILEVYPDARFVMTHRDPVQTLASISKMSLTLRGTRYDPPVDPSDVGRQMLDFVGRHIDRIMRFCRSPQGARVVHVDYYRAIDNPATVVSEVHGALGIGSPPAVSAAIADWHRRNPKNARGANPYALEQFGLDDGLVADRFKDYMQYFDVPREQEGLRRV